MDSTTDTVENLIVDLLEWVAARDRTYEEVIAAWRTSCPKLPVWEEANDRELIRYERRDADSIVHITPLGHAFLNERRPSNLRVPAALDHAVER